MLSTMPESCIRIEHSQMNTAGTAMIGAHNTFKINLSSKNKIYRSNGLLNEPISIRFPSGSAI